MFRVEIHCYHHLPAVEESALAKFGGQLMSAFTDLLNQKVSEIKSSVDAEKRRIDSLIDSMAAQIADLKQAVVSGESDPVVLEGLDAIRQTIDDYHADTGATQTAPTGEEIPPPA